MKSKKLGIGTLVKVNGRLGSICNVLPGGGYSIYFASNNAVVLYLEDEISTDVSMVSNMSEVEIGGVSSTG
ncbi:MAG: hypothetical protein GY928_31390 [Colwellia sp.]|nr:hypothetical protein [Colwellia sp.]